MPIVIVVGVRKLNRWCREHKNAVFFERIRDVAKRVSALLRLYVLKYFDECDGIELVRKRLLKLVHRRGVYWRADQKPDRRQHGRQGRLAGQRVRERLRRSIKYEEVYLRAYQGVSDARASIGRYLDFYNGRRPHSSLDGITPDHTYFTPLPFRLAA